MLVLFMYLIRMMVYASMCAYIALFFSGRSPSLFIIYIIYYPPKHIPSILHSHNILPVLDNMWFSGAYQKSSYILLRTYL